MIINTGGRTDTVQYYTRWLLKRFEEGYVLSRNPLFQHKVTRYELTPDQVEGSISGDEAKLYRLIWSRCVASQMAGARFHDTTVTVACGRTQWKAKGERLLFPGFLAVLPRGKDEGDAELPPLEAGQTLKLEKLDKEQKFTQTTARYRAPRLLREQEEQGNGRPSTYARNISPLTVSANEKLPSSPFTAVLVKPSVLVPATPSKSCTASW